MLKNTFCSSPWFHVRKTYDGSYEVCRWSNRFNGENRGDAGSVMQFYNGEQMRALRSDMLQGKSPSVCDPCYYQDAHGKLSGRSKQLLKSGVQIDNFTLTMMSSPHFDLFKYSQDNHGAASYYPVDLQIDLGRACNSSCIMCFPEYSSRLIADYTTLSEVNPELFPKPNLTPDWTLDNNAVAKFTEELVAIPDIKYIHFLGGETLFNQSLYTICSALVEHGLSETIIAGTTTNGTIYDARLEGIIPKFKQFHLGISVESAGPLNDYIRWPSRIENIKDNIKKFVELRDKSPNLTLLARITPNVFSIYYIDELFDYLFECDIIAESCNILYKPECLRIELIPDDIRQEVIDKLTALIARRNLDRSSVPNIRHPDLRHEVLSNIVFEYLHFMQTYKELDDADRHRSDLVNFLKSFESLRSNSIIEYAPRYKNFLRSFGY